MMISFQHWWGFFAKSAKNIWEFIFNSLGVRTENLLDILAFEKFLWPSTIFFFLASWAGLYPFGNISLLFSNYAELPLPFFYNVITILLTTRIYNRLIFGTFHKFIFPVSGTWSSKTSKNPKPKSLEWSHHNFWVNSL